PLTVGPTPSVTLPSSGATQRATVANVAVATLLTTGASTVTTSGTPATGQVDSDSTVASMNLASAAFTADAVEGTCSVGPSGPQASANVTNFAVGGIVQALVGANVTVNLPGLGYLVYNEQTTSSSGG